MVQAKSASQPGLQIDQLTCFSECTKSLLIAQHSTAQTKGKISANGKAKKMGEKRQELLTRQMELEGVCEGVQVNANFAVVFASQQKKYRICGLFSAHY